MASEDARARAHEMDSRDPIGHLRDAFEFDTTDVIYLDGNSLGRLPKATVDRVRRLVSDEWRSGLVESWSSWVDLPGQVGDAIAGGFCGAAPGQTVVCDSTSVNLYKLAGAALDAAPRSRRVVVTDDQNFPTDRYVLEGLAAQRGGSVRVVASDPVDGVGLGHVRGGLGDDVALVSLSHTSYRSGAVADGAAITTAVHDAGARIVWDLSHSVGAVPVELDRWGADMAVGCTYKYLNGGPGAPAFLFVRRDLQETLRPPIWGWFAHADQFAFEAAFRPQAGIGRFLAGTPPVLSMVCVQSAVEVLASSRAPELFDKRIAVTTYFIELFESRLVPLGFRLASPIDAHRRGAHVSLAHPDAMRISRALRELAGVVTDFREPDIVRFGLAPAYTRFVDVYDAVDRLVDMVRSGRHLDVAVERGRIT